MNRHSGSLTGWCNRRIHGTAAPLAGFQHHRSIITLQANPNYSRGSLLIPAVFAFTHDLYPICIEHLHLTYIIMLTSHLCAASGGWYSLQGGVLFATFYGLRSLLVDEHDVPQLAGSVVASTWLSSGLAGCYGTSIKSVARGAASGAAIGVGYHFCSIAFERFRVSYALKEHLAQTRIPEPPKNDGEPVNNFSSF